VSRCALGVRRGRRLAERLTLIRERRVASIGANLAICLMVLTVAAVPASAASAGPSPDPSPQTAAGGAAPATPPPDAVPQAQTRSSSSSSGQVASPSTHVPVTQAPPVHTSHPATVTPAPTGASAVTAPASGLTGSASGARSAPTSTSPSIRVPATALPHLSSRVAKTNHRAATASHARKEDSALLAHRTHTLVAHGAALLLAATRRDGVLLLYSAIALGCLTIASFMMLRLLTRARSEWWDGSA
jgi:hypothetical protein